MNKTWTVAWREFRHTVFTKAFVIGVVIAPLCFGAIVILAGIFLQPEAKPLVGTIAVISPDDALTSPLKESLQPEPSRTLPDINGLSPEEATGVLLSEASTTTASQVAVTEMDINIVSKDETQIDEIMTAMRLELTSWGQTIVSISMSSVVGLITVLIYLVLLPLLVFFFLKDKQVMMQWLGRFVPNEIDQERSVVSWNDDSIDSTTNLVSFGIASSIRTADASMAAASIPGNCTDGSMLTSA